MIFYNAFIFTFLLTRLACIFAAPVITSPGPDTALSNLNTGKVGAGTVSGNSQPAILKRDTAMKTAKKALIGGGIAVAAMAAMPIAPVLAGAAAVGAGGYGLYHVAKLGYKGAKALKNKFFDRKKKDPSGASPTSPVPESDSKVPPSTPQSESSSVAEKQG